MQKQISTIIGIILVVVAAVVAVSGVFAYQYFAAESQTKVLKTQTQIAQPSITVLSPNGGETVEPGQSIKVMWNVNSNYPNVQVMVVAGKAADGQYTTNGSMATFRGYIIYTGANTGSFDWIVPTDYPDAGAYLIRSEPLTSDGQASGEVSYSDNYFTIK